MMAPILASRSSSARSTYQAGPHAKTMFDMVISPAMPSVMNGTSRRSAVTMRAMRPVNSMYAMAHNPADAARAKIAAPINPPVAR